MTRFEDLKRGATVKGVIAEGPVTVIDIKRHGSEAVTLTYKDGKGGVLLYRDTETVLQLVAEGQPFSFESDGHLFKLASEAYRIRLATTADRRRCC